MENINRKKVFVTGGAGFVGSHLVDLLLENNCEVTCLVRKSTNLQWLNNKNVKIIDTGFDDQEKLTEAVKGSNIVFHVAGVVKAKKRKDYFAGNVKATQNLMDACLKTKATIENIVVVSSLTAAGPAETEEGVYESDPCVPITTYGISKLSQEHLVHGYMNELPITIVRPPAVYGERDTEIFIFFNSFSKGVTTTIGSDRKLISLIYVKDLVKGIYEAGISKISRGETYFITSFHAYTWDEIIGATAKVFGKKALRFKVPHSVLYLIAFFAQVASYFQTKAATLNMEKGRDITQQYWTCSPKKALEKLNFKSEHNLESGIKSTIDWYKKEGWL